MNLLSAALEGCVAASYSSVPKPKRKIAKRMSGLRDSLVRSKIALSKFSSIESFFIFSALSVDRFLNRAYKPINLQPKIELAIQIYNTSNRSLFDKLEFRLELDVSLRWCTLLYEQHDIKVKGSISYRFFFCY